MAYGMQKVRADDLKIPVVFDSVQLWNMSDQI